MSPFIFIKSPLLVKDGKKNGKSAIVNTIVNGSKNKWAMVFN